MYQVTVLDTKAEGSKVIATRLYREFQNAFSDVINGNSDIHAYIDDLGRGDYEANKPKMITTGSTKPNGFGDDFYFRYPNGIIIAIGEAVISDNKEVAQ